MKPTSTWYRRRPRCQATKMKVLKLKKRLKIKKCFRSQNKNFHFWLEIFRQVSVICLSVEDGIELSFDSNETDINLIKVIAHRIILKEFGNMTIQRANTFLSLNSKIVLNLINFFLFYSFFSIKSKKIWRKKDEKSRNSNEIFSWSSKFETLRNDWIKYQPINFYFHID